MTNTSTSEVRDRLNDVIEAMKANHSWDIERPADEAFVDMGAFGSRSMAFVQWLRWVFVPNVEQLLKTDGPWPSSSQVATIAVREGDTDHAVAALVRPLSRFDALFTDDDNDDDNDDDANGGDDDDDGEPPSGAAEAYARSERLLAAGDHAGALGAIAEALAADPSYPNAENFAGWILLNSPSRSTKDLEAAIEHFRAAVRDDPSEIAPLANLGNALVAAGRKDEAIALMLQQAEGAWPAGAHNWLAWWFSVGEPDLERALPHAQRAVTGRSFWGDARLNLARILEMLHRSDEAYLEHEAALGCEGDHDVAFAHERRGAYEARQGWMHNSLRSFRRALAADASRGGTRASTYLEAITWGEQQLRARGVTVPDNLESADWQRACELEIPPERALRTETGAPMAAELIEVEKLVREDRFDEALSALATVRAKDRWLLVDAIQITYPAAHRARKLGAKRQAVELLRFVLEGYQFYASGASTGAEGLGCMHDVEETERQLALWSKELV